MEVGAAHTAQSEAVETEHAAEVFSYKHENGQVMTASSAQELGRCAFFGSMESEEQRIFMARQFMLGQREQEAKVEEETLEQESENPEDTHIEIERAIDNSQETKSDKSKKEVKETVNERKPRETVTDNTNAEVDNSSQDAAQEIPAPEGQIATGASMGNDTKEAAPAIKAPSVPTGSGPNSEQDLKTEPATISSGPPPKTKHEAGAVSAPASQGTKRARSTRVSTKEPDKASSSLDIKGGQAKSDTKPSRQKSGRVANKGTGGADHENIFQPTGTVTKGRKGSKSRQQAGRHDKLNEDQSKFKGNGTIPIESQLPREEAIGAANQKPPEAPAFNGVEFAQGDEAEDNEPLEVSGIDAGEVTGDSADRIPEDEGGASDFQAKETHAGAAEDETQGQERLESDPLLSIPDENSPDLSDNNLEQVDHKDDKDFYNPIKDERAAAPAAYEAGSKETGEVDVPIEEVEETLQTLAENIGDVEAEEVKEAHQILDEIVVKANELRAGTETSAEASEEPVAAQTEKSEETKEELKELFIELFDYTEIDYTPELVDSFIKLAIKDDAMELATEIEQEEDNAAKDRGTHEAIKQLLIAVSNIKKAIMHACSIGKTALRLYSRQLA